MNLYTYYNDGEKQVFATHNNGELYFFYKGFASKEEAYNITLNAHIVAHKERKGKTNLSNSFVREWVETSLQGTWKEIK